MSGRLWLILFLLTVAIGVTVMMSSANKAELPPSEGTQLEGVPAPHVQAPKQLDESPFAAPPTEAEKKKMRADAAKATEGLAPDVSGLPGPSDPLIAPPTAAPSAPKGDLAAPDGIPTPSYASPPSPGNFPPPAYPPQVYPDAGAGAGAAGGFEGDIPPPPEGGGVDYDPEIGSGGEAPPQEDGGGF